jgi:hypothetical protein
MSKYHQVSEDIPQFPRMKGYKMACCDCGLVHNLDFTIIRKTKHRPDGAFQYEELTDKNLGIIITGKRNNRSTGQMRRHKKNKESTPDKSAQK